MQDITELERRLTAALDRIGQSVGKWTAGETERVGPDEGDTEGLHAELDAERETARGLREKLTELEASHESQVGELMADIDRASEIVEAMETERNRLRQVNEALRSSNQALREANADGLSDAHLINQSTATELDALRALREGDRAEIDQILLALSPTLDDAEKEQADG